MQKRYITERCSIDVSNDFLLDKQNRGVLLPESLTGAVLKRQCEYVAGRYCAIEAMKKLELALPTQPGTGTHREPLWPEGISGSISHSDKYAVAVVTREKLSGIGIDVESWVVPETAEQILPSVLSSQELDNKPGWMDIPVFLTIVYSAKESLFKALFNQIQRYIDFSSARFSDFQNGRLAFHLMETLGPNLPAGTTVFADVCLTFDGVETFVILE